MSLISRQQDLLKLRDKEILQLKASNHSVSSQGIHSLVMCLLLVSVIVFSFDLVDSLK